MGRIVTYRPMTPDDLRAVQALAACTFRLAPDKRFVRSMDRESRESKVITEAQAKRLWMLVQRYRGQIEAAGQMKEAA